MAAPAAGQTLNAPFDGAYSVQDLGQVPGVPDRLGGLTLKAGTTDRLLIGGEANDAPGALYEVGLVRDGAGHIVGFSGTATRFADAAYNDGGVTYGPGGVLFLARWPQNELGQTKPGSAITDKVISLTPLGIESSLASMQFVPQGQPGAGSLKLASYRGGGWYDADVVADGAGTYDLANVREIVDSRIDGGPEGFVYVPSGSPQFSGPSLLVSEYGVDEVAAYQVDANGDPRIGTRALDDLRPRRRRGRAARPGHGRLPVLHVRRRQPRHRGARLPRPASAAPGAGGGQDRQRVRRARQGSHRSGATSSSPSPPESRSRSARRSTRRRGV